MKKLLVKSLFLCVAFFSLRAEGQLRPEANSFGFEATLLYMKPIIDLPYYTMTTTATEFVNNKRVINGTRHENAMDFHGGFALAGIYVFCDPLFDVRLKWSHLQETSIDEVSSSKDLAGARFLLPQQFVPNYFQSAYSEARFHYDAIDLLLGYIPIHCCDFLSLHLGAQYARIQYEETDLFTTTDSLVDQGKWNLQMEGVGPEIGLLFKWLLPLNAFFPNIYLDGKAECGAIVGKMNSDASLNSPDFNKNFDSFLNVSNQSNYRIVPFIDLALGVSSHCYFHAFLVEFEVGYNFIHYHKALDGVQALLFPQINPIVDLFSDLNLHGVYFSVGVAY